MDNDTHKCSGCKQKDHCGQVYETLGNSKGPNVAWKVIVAFVVPIVVFILSLAVSDRLFQNRFEGKFLIAVTFLAALTVTLVVIVLLRKLRRRVKT